MIKKLLLISLWLLHGFPGSALAADLRGITIQVEFIEVKHSDLTDLIFDKPFESDSGKLRKQIQEKVRNRDADIIDTVVIRTRDTVRTNTVSADQIKYPVNYDVTGAAGFEIQNAGIFVRVEPLITEDKKTILLNIFSEFSERIADADYGNNAKGVRVIQPQFHKARMETSLLVTDGTYSFAGTARLNKAYNKNREDPIVMVFVRAMINQSDEN
ncbi:hypothetical protein QUF80_07740 [Desulfococcaceae bacterium HSG8]|nr:hypothetical protein [Desulfococcaceae bacterium HSG8]